MRAALWLLGVMVGACGVLLWLELDPPAIRSPGARDRVDSSISDLIAEIRGLRETIEAQHGLSPRPIGATGQVETSASGPTPTDNKFAKALAELEQLLRDHKLAEPSPRQPSMRRALEMAAPRDSGLLSHFFSRAEESKQALMMMTYSEVLAYLGPPVNLYGDAALVTWEYPGGRVTFVAGMVNNVIKDG